MVLDQNWFLIKLLICNLMEKNLISYIVFIFVLSWIFFLSYLIMGYRNRWSHHSFLIWSWYLISYSFSLVRIYFLLFGSYLLFICLEQDDFLQSILCEIGWKKNYSYRSYVMKIFLKDKNMWGYIVRIPFRKIFVIESNQISKMNMIST